MAHRRVDNGYLCRRRSAWPLNSRARRDRQRTEASISQINQQCRSTRLRPGNRRYPELTAANSRKNILLLTAAAVEFSSAPFIPALCILLYLPLCPLPCLRVSTPVPSLGGTGRKSAPGGADPRRPRLIAEVHRSRGPSLPLPPPSSRPSSRPLSPPLPPFLLLPPHPPPAQTWTRRTAGGW